MPEKKMNVAYTNEIIREMSGLKDLIFSGIPNTAPMDEGERLLSRMYSLHFLLVYVATGRNVETHLQHCGYKKDKLSSTWWKQFDHIRQNAAGRYTKNARYYIAASQFILRPEDNDLIQTGDVTAAARFNLATQCALLMSALHPEADHPFFKAAIGDMPEYIRKKKHPAFSPSPELTPDEWEQVEKICKGALEIYEQDVTREAAEIIARYVAKEYRKDEADDEDSVLPLSALAQSDRAFLPIARAYRLQDEIGAAGAEGTQIRVSSKGDELVTIYAKISDRDGNPISPSATHTNLCAAFGQIWEENGCQPCVVSVEKIYRTYAGLSCDEHATPQQLAEVEAAIDEMLFMPAEVNFSEQISKQKKIKKKDDIDYKDAHFKGTMIPAQKGKATYNGATVTAYKIYDMPLFYKYSHAVGQIAQVDRKLLSDISKARKSVGEGKRRRSEAEKSTGGVYGGTRVVNLRRYILTSIEDMKRIAKKSKGRPLGAGVRTILYADIADKCGYDITSAQTIRTLRSNVDGYLAELVSSGHISKYEIARDKQKYVGVRIDL